MSKAAPPYTVIRDTREQANKGWVFQPNDRCLGTVDRKLKTGDYTLLGYETQFVIERKGSVAEFAMNINQTRFTREMERLEAFPHAYVVLEFELEDVVQFPKTSTIPRDKWAELRVTPQYLMMRLNELNFRYKTKFILVGDRGREFASSLFKRVVELC